MSNTKHSPTNRIQVARQALERARESCPHWDHESDGGIDLCCEDVAVAKADLRLAKKAAAKAQS